MKKGLTYGKKLFCIALAFVVLFSISGVSIYQHTCETTFAENTSLFIPAKSCNHAIENTAAESCCKVVENTSCCTTDASNTNDDCCTDTKELKKLEVLTLVTNKTTIAKALSTITLLYWNHSIKLLNTETITFRGLYFEDPPPKLSVLGYLSLIQVYII